MVTFGGAVSYTELRNMPLPELARLHREAKRVTDELKRGT